MGLVVLALFQMLLRLKLFLLLEFIEPTPALYACELPKSSLLFVSFCILKLSSEDLEMKSVL